MKKRSAKYQAILDKLPCNNDGSVWYKGRFIEQKVSSYLPTMELPMDNVQKKKAEILIKRGYRVFTVKLTMVNDDNGNICDIDSYGRVNWWDCKMDIKSFNELKRKRVENEK